MKNLKLNLFLFLIFLLFSCGVKNKKNELPPPPEDKLHDINGFYFFKKNMSYEDVISLLTEKKIKFKVLNLNNSEEVNYPLSYQYLISSNDLIRNKNNIKILEGYDLPILKNKIPKFQISFFDNKIFYFNYDRYFDDYQSSLEGNTILNQDIELLKILSEGLSYKYGTPNENLGNLNVFFPPNPIFTNWNNNYSRGTQILERQIWIGKSKSYIKLENWISRDTSKYEPENIRIQIGTKIEVLIEPKFADEIVRINSSIDKRTDSIRNHKRKQINDLNKKQKLKEFGEL